MPVKSTSLAIDRVPRATCKGRSASGYTLIEVLIAAALSTIVIGLTLAAFQEINKVVNLQRSKTEAQATAVKGLQELSAVLKRANVYYYSARPITGPKENRTGRAGNFLTRDPAVPATLIGGGPGNTRLPPADRNQNGFHAGWVGAVPKQDFRFTDPEDAVPGAAPRLGVAVGRIAPAPIAPCVATPNYDDFFPSPMAYFAEVDFVKTKTGAFAGAAGDAINARALLPRTWTFYVLYLAPMNLPDSDANVVEAGQARDWLQAPIRAGALNAVRTAIPYELRIMTIPGVYAGDPNPEAPYVVTPPGGLAGDNVGYDPTVGRILAPGLIAPDIDFLAPPFDYDGTKNSALANYDPIPVPIIGTPADFMDPTSVANIYRFRLAGVIMGRPACGPRIAANPAPGPLHGNFNMLGNDPPTDAALINRDPAAAPITDKVLISYIDPDTVEGTCMRFVNNMQESPAGPPDVNGVIRTPDNRPYRRYLNMYGQECSYFENRYQDSWGDLTPSPTGAYGALPSRALLSVSIRYRNRKDLPFQFATLQSEIDLDGVKTFDRIRPRR